LKGSFNNHHTIAIKLLFINVMTLYINIITFIISYMMNFVNNLYIICNLLTNLIMVMWIKTAKKEMMVNSY